MAHIKGTKRTCKESAREHTVMSSSHFFLSRNERKQKAYFTFMQYTKQQLFKSHTSEIAEGRTVCFSN